MKSFFTKLGTLLLCGVAAAMVGCTDFSEDIQASKSELESSIANLSSSTDVKVKDLQDAINALSAQLAADYATKQELANVQSTLTNDINTKVNNLTTQVNKVGNDLSAAVESVNSSIAALQQADAANKTALENAINAAKAEAATAIANLQAALDAQKTGLEAEIAAVEKEIADTKAELEAVIAEKAGKEYVDEELGKVDAKANELFNTLQSLSEYLGTLEAQIAELNNTLISLSQYLPTVEAKIAQNTEDIAANTAKVNELKNELLSLSEHLSESEALVKAQLSELQNTLLSLGVYMDTLEASIDARFAEILNTIESLSIHLVEVEAQVALNKQSAADANAKAEELYNTLLSLSYDYNEEKAANAAKFAEVLATFESLSQHLAQKEAEHEAGIADNSAKIAELKSELVSLSQYLEEANYDGKFQEIQNTLLALSDHLAAEEAANLAKFAEILSTFESLSQHLAEEEASNDAKFVELFNTLQSLSPVIDNLDAKILEVKNTVESLGNVVMDSLAVHNAKIYELQGTLLSLSMFLEEANLIVRVSALEDDLEAHLAAYEVFQAATIDDLANLFARTEQLFGQLEALSPEVTTIKSQIAELKNELLSLSEHLADREAQVDDKLAELFATFQSLSPVIAQMQAQILENNSALQSLSPVIAEMKAQILENFNTLQSLSPKIEELEDKDAELATMINEVRNQIVSLEPVIATMQAQINENKGTLDSLSEYLPELKAELEEKISAVDAKANELNGQLTALAEQLPVMFAEVNASIKAVADRVTKIEVDVQGLKNTLNDLQAALDAAKKELGDKDAVMANTLDGLKQLCKDQQDLIGANIDNIYKNAQDIAVLYLQVADLVERMNDADDFSAQLNMTIQQLSSQMWEMFGLVDTQLGAITEAYTAADAEIRAELEAGLAEVLELAIKNDSGVMDNVRQFELKVQTIVEELRAQLATLTKRVQSLVYVPEYSDGKANVHYGAVINLNANILNLADVAFVPAKTTLRYKVNSTSATIVDEIVKAYETNPAILSYDVEGVKVRGASANGATLEVVGVSKDKDGYLAVDVLAKNFDKAFYLTSIKSTDKQNNSILGGIWDALFGDNATSLLDKLLALAADVDYTKGYSAALVLSEAETVNNVASEFTNLVADKNYDLLQLGARYTNDGKTNVLTALESRPYQKQPYVATHDIPSSDTTLVINTTANEPVVQLVKDGKTVTCTVDELYTKYGYAVEIKSHRHIVSYLKDEKLDPANSAVKDWNDNVASYNTATYNVVSDAADAIGTSRAVSLKPCATSQLYSQRVGNWIDVVDVYYLEGQSVAIADKVNITKNIVNIDFPTRVNYKWTLQRAIDLRNSAPYDKAIELNNIPYTNIYDLASVLGGTVKEKTISLNGKVVTDTDIDIVPISGPSTTSGAGIARLVLQPGYKFAADQENIYSVRMKVDFDAETDAIITATIALGQLPEKVEVVSETVPVYQIPGTPDFKAELPLVKMAYDEFSKVVDANNKNYIGFNEENLEKPYQVMFDVLKSGNTVTNTPESAYNMNFNVVGNVDKTNVMLFGSQWTNAGKPETLTVKRVYEPTWFGVPFEFTVPLKPVLPEIALVRSTEYASAVEGEDKVFSVQVQARVVEGVYTVKQSDLANYLNVVGKDAHETQTVKFTVMDDYKGLISPNSEVGLEVYAEPIDNPLTGLITARLVKDLAILTWTDEHTQIKVKAQLFSNEYLMDEVVLILNVKDPLTFVAPSFEVKREIEKDTEVSVFQEYELWSSAVDNNQDLAHPDQLIQYAAPTVNDLVTPEVAYAYGIKFTLAKRGVYERVTLPDGTTKDVLYDDTKYSLDLETGKFILFKDDAAELLNPIVAILTVSYEHNVHNVSSTVCQPVTYEVKFVNELSK